MQPYRNLGGDSGIAAWQAGPGSLTIRFRSGDTYRYDTEKPGRLHLARMKALALAGRGLSTYISQHVRDNYAAKL